MQQRGETFRATVNAIWDGGLKSMFRGVTASAFRQATYGGLRLALYEPIRNALSSEGSATVALQTQLLAGAFAGGFSSAVMCPADVVKIRLQTGEAGYRGVADAIFSIARLEGVPMLWRGVVPTSTRAAVVASVELGLYDATKVWLSKVLSENQPRILTLTASIIATVGAVAISFPIDVTKTILINQGAGASGATQFRGMVHCFAYILKSRGPLGMYNGCMPSLARQLVCNSVMFVVYEEIKLIFWRTQPL
jgi:hypothetical protein